MLAEVIAASPTHALAALGTTELLTELTRPTTLVWLVAGVGRVLPPRLFDVMMRQLDPPEEHGFELLDLQIADRVAGPTGLDRPGNLTRRIDCPVAPELLRIS